MQDHGPNFQIFLTWPVISRNNHCWLLKYQEWEPSCPPNPDLKYSLKKLRFEIITLTKRTLHTSKKEVLSPSHTEKGSEINPGLLSPILYSQQLTNQYNLIRTFDWWVLRWQTHRRSIIIHFWKDELFYWNELWWAVH